MRGGRNGEVCVVAFEGGQQCSGDGGARGNGEGGGWI
jgi:hypothetical protein